jgi:hypothetical protein
MIQSGDGDWIINSHPSGADAQGTCDGHRTLNNMLVLTGKAFYLAASHLPSPKRLRAGRPPNKKTYLLCALGASAVKILFWTRMTVLTYQPWFIE